MAEEDTGILFQYQDLIVRSEIIVVFLM